MLELVDWRVLYFFGGHAHTFTKVLVSDHGANISATGDYYGPQCKRLLKKLTILGHGAKTSDKLNIFGDGAKTSGKLADLGHDAKTPAELTVLCHGAKASTKLYCSLPWCKSTKTPAKLTDCTWAWCRTSAKLPLLATMQIHSSKLTVLGHGANTPVMLTGLGGGADTFFKTDYTWLRCNELGKATRPGHSGKTSAKLTVLGHGAKTSPKLTLLGHGAKTSAKLTVLGHDTKTSATLTLLGQRSKISAKRTDLGHGEKTFAKLLGLGRGTKVSAKLIVLRHGAKTSVKLTFLAMVHRRLLG